MKFLVELNETVEYLVEGEGSARKHFIQGLFLEFDHPNKNKRIYRSEMLDENVKTYINEKVKEKRAWGELDHPDGPVVSLKNASHRIVEMHKDGSNWLGKAIILNSGNGSLVKGLLESEGNIGVSSRGMGSVKTVNESIIEVQPDYKILTAADIVSDPSAHGAFVKGIMENVEYFFDDNLGWISEDVKKKVKKMSLSEIEDNKVRMFTNFLVELKNIK